MYLVRAIQTRETAKWVNQLGVDPEATLPLPFVPRRTFDKLIIVHGNRVLGFVLADIELVDEDSVVGSAGSIVIAAKSKIHVKRGKPRLGQSKTAGFQGIRYARRWSDVAR